jgi:hypothetical protein
MIDGLREVDGRNSVDETGINVRGCITTKSSACRLKKGRDHSCYQKNIYILVTLLSLSRFSCDVSV